jgi:hypothetical protein
MLTDFPKIHCPFIRQTFKVNKEKWEQVGSGLQLREPKVYLVVNQVNPGYEWVFDDPETIAVEKLNGTNVKLRTERGKLVELQNRKNVIDPLQIIKGKGYILEGIFQAISKGYVKPDGEQAGEVIGPKLQGNPYLLTTHVWYPFEKAVGDLRYKSFHEHERTFDNWSSWFKNGLMSRFVAKRSHKMDPITPTVLAEGVVFYNFARKAQGLTWMAKLRRDMFDWFYSDQLQIIDYNKNGKPGTENQENFD